MSGKRTGLPILSTSMGHFGGFTVLPPDEQDEIAGHIRALIPFTHALGTDRCSRTAGTAGTCRPAN